MNRMRTVLVSAVVGVAALSLGACGDGDPTPKPTRTTTTASPTPTVPPQPKGADGVTYDVQNWDEYASDPAVLVWKQLSETLSASVNQGRLVPRASSLSSRSMLRQILTNLRFAWSHDLRVRPVAQVAVLRSRGNGPRTRLVTCSWDVSADYYRADGTFYGEPESIWHKDVWTVEQQGNRHVVTSLEPSGTCRLKPPS